MGDLSEHFSRSEFACKGKNCCGGSAPVSLELVNGLESLRNFVSDVLKKETSLTVNSGFRCVKHNSFVNGAPKSKHIEGVAADIHTPFGLTDKEFAEIAGGIYAFREGGIGIYDGRIHVDVRKDGPARWDARK